MKKKILAFIVAGSSAKVDTGSKSPQTGVGLGGVAAGTVAMAAIASVVAMALRKKLSEWAPVKTRAFARISILDGKPASVGFPLCREGFARS